MHYQSKVWTYLTDLMSCDNFKKKKKKVLIRCVQTLTGSVILNKYNLLHKMSEQMFTIYHVMIRL